MTNNYKKNADKKFGRINEKKVQRFLNDNVFIDDNFSLFKNIYSTMDFINKEYLGELKSRRCFSYSYPDFMLNLNKLKEGETSKKPHIYYFLFKDGLYQWDFNKDQYTIKYGGRQDRGKDERKNYGYVEFKDLTLISKDINSNITPQDLLDFH